jgi:hypothetical protein
MFSVFRWLAPPRKPKYHETVLEESEHDASDLRDAYRELVADELRRWKIPDGAVAIEIRRDGYSPGAASFVAILRLLEWHGAATLPLLLGLPFLEKRLRRTVQSHWLADLSAFKGVWLHASERMLAAPGIGELRELLVSLTNVRVQDSVLAKEQDEPEGTRMSSGPASAALRAWHEADDRAHEVERRVREASLAREAHGIPIPEGLLHELLRTRAEANTRLRSAIARS